MVASTKAESSSLSSFIPRVAVTGTFGPAHGDTAAFSVSFVFKEKQSLPQKEEHVPGLIFSGYIKRPDLNSMPSGFGAVKKTRYRIINSFNSLLAVDMCVCVCVCCKVIDMGGDALSGVKRLQEMTRKDVAMWKGLFKISAFFTVPLLLFHWLQVSHTPSGSAQR